MTLTRQENKFLVRRTHPATAGRSGILCEAPLWRRTPDHQCPRYVCTVLRRQRPVPGLRCVCRPQATRIRSSSLDIFLLATSTREDRFAPENGRSRTGSVRLASSGPCTGACRGCGSSGRCPCVRSAPSGRGGRFLAVLAGRPARRQPRS